MSHDAEALAGAGGRARLCYRELMLVKDFACGTEQLKLMCPWFAEALVMI